MDEEKQDKMFVVLEKMHGVVAKVLGDLSSHGEQEGWGEEEAATAVSTVGCLLLKHLEFCNGLGPDWTQRLLSTFPKAQVSMMPVYEQMEQTEELRGWLKRRCEHFEIEVPGWLEEEDDAGQEG